MHVYLSHGKASSASALCFEPETTEEDKLISVVVNMIVKTGSLNLHPLVRDDSCERVDNDDVDAVS